jgi:hypothetical protein
MFIKNNKKAKSCRICSSNKIQSLINLKKKPIVHHLKKTKKQKSSTFPFHLVIYKGCYFL